MEDDIFGKLILEGGSGEDFFKWSKMNGNENKTLEDYLKFLRGLNDGKR